MANRVREIMSADVEVIKADETIRDAARRLAERNVGAMPICDGERLMGMLTDRDVVTKVVANDKDPKSVRARELETGKPVTIGADDSLDEALRTMANHKVRRLPVIDGHSLIGMLSLADLAKALPPEKAGELLVAVSE